MSGDDLDDFAALWRGEPTAEEQKALEILARRASRRARITQRLEIGVGILLLLAVALALLASPAPAALFASAAFAAGLIWSSWKRYHLNEVARILDTSDREVLIESALASSRARLRHSMLGISLLIPGYILGAATKYALIEGHLMGFIETLLAHTIPSSRTGVIALLLLAAVMAYLVRGHLKLRRENDNLRALRDQYRAEAQLDALSEQ